MLCLVTVLDGAIGGVITEWFGGLILERVLAVDTFRGCPLGDGGNGAWKPLRGSLKMSLYLGGGWNTHTLADCSEPMVGGDGGRDG